MTLMEQCQIWNENSEYQRIIDAITALPEETQTPELISELARAYNNLANVDDRELFQKAVDLLKSVEPHFEGDHNWNFRLAFSYYYLDKEGPALHYFEKALEARPGDEDTTTFIEDCRRRLGMPRFEKCFRERTVECWDAFQQSEGQLRRLLDQRDAETAGEELIRQCSKLLNLAFESVSFELGFNGKKYELILTPEGDRAKLFELVYFQRHAPASVLEHWNILVGRQPSTGLGLHSFGLALSPNDVQAWADRKGDAGIALTLYCEKVLPLMEEDVGKAWWMLSILTDQVLGELPAMRLIDGFEAVDAPRAEPGIPLEELPQALETMGLDLDPDPVQYLKNGYTAYELEPEKDPEADWRLDVFAGSTSCPVLVNEYLRGESDAMDAFHQDGAVPGFLCYPLDCFNGEPERGKAVLDFRDALESAILEAAGADAVTFIGGASGLYCGYLDFIAWDLPAVLDAAKSFFKDSPANWANFHVFRRDVSTVRLKTEVPETSPELYTAEEMDAVEQHIAAYFGAFPNVFHEILSPDIHVDICVIPPTEEKNYYTLATMGMGAHRMDVPEELAARKLNRAELVICLPGHWKVDDEEEAWYWPIRLLKQLARLPGKCDTWLGWGHTVDHQEPYAQTTDLRAAILTHPQGTADGAGVCTLPNGEDVNFYQVIPLYHDEMAYKMEFSAEALLERMAGISFVVDPDRPGACTSESFIEAQVMDDADWHLESIREKRLPVEDLTAFQHLAIYLRWCMEHGLMGEEFLEQFGDVVQQIQTDPQSLDLRAFVRDALDGRLLRSYFDKTGAAFARYYYDEPGVKPYFPSDVDDYALAYFGERRYHSDEFQSEAYLFIPFDETYYQAMAQTVDRRWTAWHQLTAEPDTAADAEPSALAKAMMDYLNCPCQYFPPMVDDDPITAAYGYAKRLGPREGFVPMLVAVDQTLWECLMMNTHGDGGREDGAFDAEKTAQYRKAMLSAAVNDGAQILQALLKARKAEAGDDDMDWPQEVLGGMTGGTSNHRFLGYWDYQTKKTVPLILAEVPVRHPWEIFAYLPFGNWNECPDTPVLMAAAKHWFQQYGAVPAAMTHDVLEFRVPVPVPQEAAMDLALEQYAFCPDVVEQGPEGSAVGTLADGLRQSTMWYFWWD